MNNFLFIINNFPNDFSKICDYEDFRPYDEKIHDSKFTFSQFAHERLSEIFNERQYDLIILPYSLDEENYLTFTGINVALHIRLTPSLKHTNIPILFIGPESIDEILKLAPYPHLLSTSGIFHTKKRNLEDIKKQAKWILTNKPKLSTFDYKNFINKITLQPPSFYDNRHSITNEWALLFLDSISGHNILKDKSELQEIQSNLYVKWLMIKNGIQLPDENSNKEKFLIPNTKGKRILLIDDEWHKGWLELFRAFLGHKIDGTIVDYIHIEKNSTEDEINEKLEVKLQEEWDLFLLDIRLTDNDHKKDTDYFEYTGFTLLDKIIDSNKGNQVILTSASNKYQIYQWGLDLDAAEIFIKPSVESSITLNDFDHLIDAPISRCLEKGYLKIFYKQIIEVENLLDSYFFDKTKSVKKFISDCKSILDIGFELLGQAYKKKEFGRYTYLQFFTIIEAFVQLEEVFLKSDDNSFVVIDNTTKVCVLKLKKENRHKKEKIYESALSFNGNYKLSPSEFKQRIDTNFKMSSLLLLKYGLSTSGEKNWTKVNKVRNNCAHKNFHPTLDDIKDLLGFLKFILNQSNIDQRNIEKGLTPPTFEESMDKLREKWGN